MALGKTIELFLKSDTFDGIVEATVAGFSMQGFKVGRSIGDIDSVSELDRPGVYFLFCGGPSDGVYIGESVNVKNRLKQHINGYPKFESYYWTEALCFIEPKLSINTKYCEGRLVKDAIDLKNYKILTKASGIISSLSSSSKATNEQFIEHVEMLVGTFGKNIYSKIGASSIPSSPSPSPKSSSKPIPPASSSTYYYKKAKMIIDKTGFVVLAGSKISNITTHSLQSDIAKLRKDLISKGAIDSSYTLRINQAFGSASAAAQFVAGYSTNGLMDWKDARGVELKKII